ncbi:MAG: ketol-acid reductoisomerase [Oscillospiraceae bacterium]|nr:ketol-acid reductoisomerase [Oscillospiraceae bacterium]
MGRMYYDADCNPELIKGMKVAVIGYGAQGRAQALNLRESGVDVLIGLYEGSKSAEVAKRESFTVLSAADATAQADFVVMLVNDEKMKDIYEESVAPNIKAGAALCFAHGFNIRYGQITPPGNIDVIMVSPKGVGNVVRSDYQAGRGVPGLIAIEQDATGNAKELSLSYAWAIGCGRCGILQTTFAEETETDLFAEQCVLCGGVTALMQAGFETLVEAGYQPESAYFECVHEMKLIIDLVAAKGFAYMRDAISDTAEYGDYMIGPRMITPAIKAEMKKVLAEVKDGTFAKNWIAETAAGKPNMAKFRAEQTDTLVEEVGGRLRKNMSWED